MTDEHEKLYLHRANERANLPEGFIPINELIYEVQTIKNYELFVKLYNLGVDVVGIRTVAFIVNKINLKNNWTCRNYKRRRNSE